MNIQNGTINRRGGLKRSLRRGLLPGIFFLAGCSNIFSALDPPQKVNTRSLNDLLAALDDLPGLYEQVADSEPDRTAGIKTLKSYLDQAELSGATPGNRYMKTAYLLAGLTLREKGAEQIVERFYRAVFTTVLLEASGPQTRSGILHKAFETAFGSVQKTPQEIQSILTVFANAGSALERYGKAVKAGVRWSKGLSREKAAEWALVTGFIDALVTLNSPADFYQFLIGKKPGFKIPAGKNIGEIFENGLNTKPELAAVVESVLNLDLLDAV